MYGKDQIEEFEGLIGIGPTKVAVFLGCKWSTYVEYKNDRRPEKKQRPAPDHVLYSIEAHTALSSAQRKKLIAERALLDNDALEFTGDLIKAFEKNLGLGPTYCAELLGRPYTTYSEYKNGRQKIPVHIAFSIEAHLLLPRSELRKLMDQRLNLVKLGNLTKNRIKALEKKFKDPDESYIRLLLGCSLDKYKAYKAGEEAMPYRSTDTVDVMLQLAAKKLQAMITDRVEGDLETVPVVSDLQEFQDRLELDAGNTSELFSVSKPGYAKWLKSEELPEDVSTLLYVLNQISDKKVKEMVESYM